MVAASVNLNIDVIFFAEELHGWRGQLVGLQILWWAGWDSFSGRWVRSQQQQQKQPGSLDGTCSFPCRQWKHHLPMPERKISSVCGMPPVWSQWWESIFPERPVHNYVYFGPKMFKKSQHTQSTFCIMVVSVCCSWWFFSAPCTQVNFKASMSWCPLFK